GLDTTVILVASAVESDLLDASSLGLLGDALADQGRGGGIATVLDLVAHFLLGGRGRGPDLAAVARNHAGVDVQVRTGDRQTHGALQGDTCTRLACATQALFLLACCHDESAPYFFLVSFKTTRSSA